jgi:carbonic anhydrase
METILDDVWQAHPDYSATFGKGDLPMPPSRRFAILTCMDTRPDPAEYASLSEGDTHRIHWRTLKDQAASILEDAVRIMSHPLVPADIPVCGFAYDIKCGRLLEVPAATETGRTS